MLSRDQAGRFTMEREGGCPPGLRTTEVMCMARFDVGVTIKRPLNEVFAVLSDFSNGVKWASGAVEPAQKITDGPIGVGTTWHGVGKVAGRRFVTDATCTEFEADRKITLTLTKPFPTTSAVTFESVAGGTPSQPDHRLRARRLLQAGRTARGDDGQATVPGRPRQPPRPHGGERALARCANRTPRSALAGSH